VLAGPPTSVADCVPAPTNPVVMNRLPGRALAAMPEITLIVSARAATIDPRFKLEVMFENIHVPFKSTRSTAAIRLGATNARIRLS